jgi:hypothetical protein
MARTPDQAIYPCFECHGLDEQCERCGGAQFQLWENLTEEEQDAVLYAWENPDKEYPREPTTGL